MMYLRKVFLLRVYIKCFHVYSFSYKELLMPTMKLMIMKKSIKIWLKKKKSDNRKKQYEKMDSN